MYVPLDVNFPDDEKIEAAGLDGAGLYAMALCVAKRVLTDGRLSRVKLRKLGGTDQLVDRLVTIGLFEVREGDDESVWVSAWLEHNPSAADIEKQRQADAKRKRLSRPKRPAGQPTDSKRTPPGIRPVSGPCPRVEVEGQSEGQGQGQSEGITTQVVSPTGRDANGPDQTMTTDVRIEVAQARALRLGRTNPTRAWLQAVATTLDATECADLAAGGMTPASIDTHLDRSNDLATTLGLPGGQPTRLEQTRPGLRDAATVHADAMPTVPVDPGHARQALTAARAALTHTETP